MTSRLQRLVDTTLPLRMRAQRLLDTPAGRPLLGRLVTMYSRARRGAKVRVLYSDGMWIHHHTDGCLVNRVIDTTLLKTIDSVTHDTFLHRLSLSPGDTVIDVGAGIGTETITFCTLVTDSGRCIAIEAHPETARCLQKTCDLNRLTQVEVLQCAASDADGELRITEDDDHIKSQIRGTNEAGGFVVPSRRLDRVIEERGLNEIALLKMNIEGAELMALRGMGDYLTRVRQVAISCHDFLAASPNDWRRTFEGTRQLLSDAGFELWCREADPRPWVRSTWYGARRS